MSTEDRLTVPDQVYLTWVSAPDGHSFDLPISPTRAKALADALNEYAKRCVDVKRALEVLGDGGDAYRQARERKHAQFNNVMGVVEHVLAHIGVHAQ